MFANKEGSLLRVIGLTGSIACGKSVVSQALRSRDYPVIDGDVLSRELTAPGGAALPEIRRVFGDGVFDSSGCLNRRALGQRVFSDAAALDRLNTLMAPFLRSLTEQRLAEARASGARLCFLEMPLLFEQGYDTYCDTVWCVWLPESVQLARLMERDGLSETEARQRMDSVLSPDEKAGRSQTVIDNSGTVEETLEKLPTLLEEELRKAAPRRRRSARYETAASESPGSTPQSSPSPVPSSPAAPSAVSPSSVSRDAASVSPVFKSPVSPDPVSSSPPLFSPSPPPVSSASPVLQAPASPAFPEAIDRPDSVRRKPSGRKVSWSLPTWLMVLLITAAAILAVSFTAHWLMRAYLTRQQEQHLAEQQAIDENYPLLYRDLIEEYATRYNLRPAYVSAIIRNESSFDPNAVSRVGARGLMQLMPDTAEWIAHKLKISGYAFERMYDPASNILFGCWYLNYLSNLFRGDPVAVTCAYHAGQGEVASWLSLYSEDGLTLTLDNLPEGPTRQYAGRVTRDDGIYQAKYFTADASAAADADPSVLP